MFARPLFAAALLAAAACIVATQPGSAQQRGSRHPRVEVLQRIPVVGRCVDPGTGIEAPYEGELDLTKSSDGPEPRWGGSLALPDAEASRQLDATLDAIINGRRHVRPPHMVSFLDIGGPPQGAEPITLDGVGTDLVQEGREERWVSFAVRCTLRRR